MPDNYWVKVTGFESLVKALEALTNAYGKLNAQVIVPVNDSLELAVNEDPEVNTVFGQKQTKGQYKALSLRYFRLNAVVRPQG